MSETTFRCAQCGAQQSPPADAQLIRCAFCETPLAVTGEGLVFSETLVPTVSDEQARAHLRRFLAGRETVAGLDREATIDLPKLSYFPFWAFTLVWGERTKTVLMPATPTALQGFVGMTLSAGATHPGVPAATERHDPEVPLATAQQWLTESSAENRVAKRTRVALAYLPLYEIGYLYRGRRYRAAVDAVSGGVFPADYPAKREAPFWLVAGASLLVFGLLGLIIANPLLKIVAYLICAGPLFLAALLVARRV